MDNDIIRSLLKHGARVDNVYKTHRKVLGKLSSEHPPENPLAFLIIGNGGAGKSTFLKAFMTDLSLGQRLKITKARPVSGVDEKTVGIIPYLFDSRRFGRVAIYDFAGQKEFCACHSAVLGNAVHTSPPVVILCIDLQETKEEITVATTYWMNLIQNQCSALQNQAHVIVIGSHADKLQLRGLDPKSKEDIFAHIIEKFPNFKYVAFVPIDCRLADSEGMKVVRRHLEKSSALLRSPEAINLNAHTFYIYLFDSFKDELAVSLKTLREKFQADLQQAQSKSKMDLLSFIPNTLPRVVEICCQLNKKGHILFLLNEANPEESYIVCDQQTLLSEVTGTVFAPEGFRQHCHLASSTGVVALIKFSDRFKQHNIKMLVAFMTYLELCFEIKDKEVLEHICERELESTEGASAHLDGRYLFFPGLIKIDVPERVWEVHFHYKYHFGWILRCSQVVQFFDSRCLQVLILRLVFTFNLAPASTIQHDIPALQRFCSVWKSGICWCEDNGITCLVELIEHGKALAVQMRSDELTPEYLDLRRRVMIKVLEAAQELCPNLSTVESVILPAEVEAHPLNPTSKLSLFGMRDLAAAIVHHKKNVKSMYGPAPLLDLLQFEPYEALGSEISNFLLHPRNPSLKEKVSNTFLAHFVDQVEDLECKSLFNHILAQNVPSQSSKVQPKREMSQIIEAWRKGTDGTYQCLRETLDRYSILGGRNPFVSYRLCNVCLYFS